MNFPSGHSFLVHVERFFLSELVMCCPSSLFRFRAEVDMTWEGAWLPVLVLIAVRGMAPSSH